LSDLLGLYLQRGQQMLETVTIGEIGIEMKLEQIRKYMIERYDEIKTYRDNSASESGETFYRSKLFELEDLFSAFFNEDIKTAK
jgi:hypothetical protein